MADMPNELKKILRQARKYTSKGKKKRLSHGVYPMAVCWMIIGENRKRDA
jgi:hypothetical protein